MIGQTLGHYRIDAQLGAGGMGVVYRAHDTTLERSVAIKVLGERMLDEPNARARFLREARTASALNHPNICTVHEVGEENGQAYIVMEHVEGRPLNYVLALGILPDAVVRYGIQIADALAHAHERGIVHRDLKTNNVIITPAGRAKVLDFGLAKRLPAEELAEEPTRAADSLTEAGQIVGTLHYLAPEVLRGRAADTRTDVWALGVLLYELATGDRPFRGQTKFEVTSAILGQPPRPLPESVPAGLRSVIERCLAKEPGERYQRGSEVHAVLDAIQSGSFTPERTPRPKPGWRRWLLSGAAAATVLALGLVGARFFASRTQSIDSIAVLPFTNVGGDPETEYLSDGVTESLIGSLSRIPGLKVIAFGSVLRYKGRSVDPQEVVRDLGVAAMVIGRVTPKGDHLSLTTELIDTRDKTHLWGRQFEVKTATLPTVQYEISSELATRLRHRLDDPGTSPVPKRYTENSEAYDFCLKGRYYQNKFTSEGYQKAIEFYKRAIEKDPAYAPAYAGLAMVYIPMTVEGYLRPEEGYRNVEAAATRALALDQGLGEALYARGVLKLWRGDRVGAEEDRQRALALDPENPLLRRFHVNGLRQRGRWDEAIAEGKRALGLDPLGIETNKQLGVTYAWAGRYHLAIEQLKKTLDLDPSYGPVHEMLHDVYARQEMHEEAIAELQQAFLFAGDKESAEALGEDFRALGFETVMRQLYQSTLDSLKEAAKSTYVPPPRLAAACAKLGEKDEAFVWLEKAYAERSPWLNYIKTDPDFESLRSDPRFSDLVKRLGIPP